MPGVKHCVAVLGYDTQLGCTAPTAPANSKVYVEGTDELQVPSGDALLPRELSSGGDFAYQPSGAVADSSIACAPLDGAVYPYVTCAADNIAQIDGIAGADPVNRLLPPIGLLAAISLATWYGLRWRKRRAAERAAREERLRGQPSFRQ